MDDSSSNIEFFNNDLILEILLRLPVKSLLRFCSVCKSWKAFITSDYFIKSHLKQSLQSSPNNFNEVRIYSEAEFRKSNLWNIFQMPYYFLAGSSNGILCYYSKSLISNLILVHLWNPATHHFRSIPQGYYRHSGNQQILVKFTFDSMRDDYKIVKILFGRHQTSLPLKGEIYSLITNSWKKINLRSWNIRRWVGSNIIIHNGALYCITASALTRKIVLGVFDIQEERYDEVALPGTDFKRRPMASLESLKEFVALSIWREEFEVWLMKEYGVWTKHIVLENNPFVHSPYGITSSGKLFVVKWNGEDVLYDAKRHVVQKYVHNKVIFLKENVYYSVPETDHMVVVDYVESMVSLLPPAEETREQNALSIFNST